MYIKNQKNKKEEKEKEIYYQKKESWVRIINNDPEIITRTYYLKKKTVITKTNWLTRGFLQNVWTKKKKNETRIVLVKRFDENGSVEKGSRVSKAGNCFLSAFFESLFQSGRGFSREFSKECLNVYRRSVNRFYATAFSGLSGILFQFIARFSFPSFTVGMLKRSDKIE